MIRIRNVPDRIHRELKARAARAGMSLSDFLNREIARVAETPLLADVLERIHRLGSVELSESQAQAVRAERETR